MHHIPLHDHSVVHVAHLVTRKESGHHIIGREDISDYILVPREGYEMVRLLRQGKTIQQVRSQLAYDYGEVDVKEFVRMLAKHGFVEEIDHKRLELHRIVHIRRLFSFIPQERVQWLFSKPLYLLYGLVILLGLLLLIKNPQYFPSYEDYFFVGIYSIVVPSSFVLGWLFVFLHEFAHYVAARSLGISAKFGISNRLFYVVAITDVTNLYSVDKAKRFRVMAAGLVVDLFIICLGFILLGLIDQGVWGAGLLVYKIIKLAIMIEFFGLVWQLLFYLRTDVYYIFETWAGVYNLHQKTMVFLKNRLFKRRIRVHYTSASERHLVSMYGWLVGLGVFMMLLMTAFYSLPILVTILGNTIKTVFTTALSGNLGYFYDSLVFLWFFAINQSLLIYSLIRKYDLLRKTAFFLVMLMLFLATNYFIIFFVALFFLRAVSEPLVTYAVLVATGALFSMILLKTLKRLNSITKVRIYPEMFLFAITLVYGYILAEFSDFFIGRIGAADIVGVSLGISYALGMAIGYLWHFEKAIRGR